VNETTFIAAVQAALLASPHPMVNVEKEMAADGFSEAVGDMYAHKYTVEDAVAYLQLSEDFNPTLKEEVALAAMSAICSKYDWD